MEQRQIDKIATVDFNGVKTSADVVDKLLDELRSRLYHAVAAEQGIRVTAHTAIDFDGQTAGDSFALHLYITS
jgi:hypothetical protein